MKKIILMVGTWFAATVMLSGAAFAHVVVTPDQVGVAKFQTFDVSVPNERDDAVSSLRLLLPSGLKEVSPTAKPDWQINVKKSGEGNNATVTEIDWTAGNIPVGLRDDFTFSAQVPSGPTTLQWKAYQTYADGTTISWDQTPSGSDDANGTSGPYSETKIVNDVTAATSTATSTSQTAEYVSGIAVIIALGAFVITLRKAKT